MTFLPGPPLPRCAECGRAAPPRVGGCCLCSDSDSPTVTDDNRGNAIELRPVEREPVRDVVWGRPHPDPEVEAEARRRSTAPPTRGNYMRWYAALERHRDDVAEIKRRAIMSTAPRRFTFAERQRRFAETLESDLDRLRREARR